ncbi:MAG: sigma-70 family RNA polymerase sigma factor [bacterium]
MAFEDEALVEKAQKGDHAAFEELVKRYERKIYNLAYKIMGNAEDASDVLQETFITAFRKLSTFRRESNFSTWVYRVAVNVCLMKKRKEKKMKTVSLDVPILYKDKDEIKRELSDDWAKNPLATLENKELKETLNEAIKSLPEEYRTVFTLKGVEGLSNNEIAKILKISLPAVKSRLHRARLFLRDKISEYFKTQETGK